MPALDLTEPGHLLAKLGHECQALLADNSNSYAAINAMRDAYHLSEWIWAGRLKGNRPLLLSITGTMRGKKKGGDTWDDYVYNTCPDFKVVEELCNGSKHFRPGSEIRGNHRAGWDGPIFTWDNFRWDDSNHYVELKDGRFLSMTDLAIPVHDFWRDLFVRFPQLA